MRVDLPKRNEYMYDIVDNSPIRHHKPRKRDIALDLLLSPIVFLPLLACTWVGVYVIAVYGFGFEFDRSTIAIAIVVGFLIGLRR